METKRIKFPCSFVHNRKCQTFLSYCFSNKSSFNPGALNFLAVINSEQTTNLLDETTQIKLLPTLEPESLILMTLRSWNTVINFHGHHLEGRPMELILHSQNQQFWGWACYHLLGYSRHIIIFINGTIA